MNQVADGVRVGVECSSCLTKRLRFLKSVSGSIMVQGALRAALSCRSMEN